MKSIKSIYLLVAMILITISSTIICLKKNREQWVLVNVIKKYKIENKQLSFNLRNIHLLKNSSDYLKSLIQISKHDTDLVFCFNQLSCMDCVYYEIGKNLQKKSAIILFLPH